MSERPKSDLSHLGLPEIARRLVKATVTKPVTNNAGSFVTPAKEKPAPKSKGGRPALGEKAMTDAERMRKMRAARKAK